MPAHPIYRIYSQLENTELKIWRRFEVTGSITVARLAYILMTMYEMQASHLFAFERTIAYPEQKRLAAHRTLQITYELPLDDEFDDFGEDDELGENTETIDATLVTIKALFEHVKGNATFLYDFGDGWEISLVCEAIIHESDLPGNLFPRVLEGEGYGILEDCGGTGGLEEIAAAYQAGAGEAYDQFVEWLGREKFDITELDLDDMNFRLKKVPRIYRDIYEYELEPTPQSMKILRRAYKNKK